MAVPFVFAGVANGTLIPLYQLDANFQTGIVLGANTLYLGDTLSNISNLTLTNPVINQATINAVSIFTTTAPSGPGITSLFASPPAIGSTSGSNGFFNTLTANSTVSGNGIINLFASPYNIGSVTPANGNFLNLTAAVLTINTSSSNTVTANNGNFRNLVVSNNTYFQEVYSAPDGTVLSPIADVLGNTQNAASLAVASYINNTNGAVIVGAKSRASVPGSRSIVASGDTLLTVVGEGDDGTNLLRAGSIAVTVDGTPSTGVMPGRITISTSNSSSSLVPRITINANGKVGISNTNPVYDLDIYGDINVQGNFRQNGALFSGGAKGGGTDQVFYENDQVVTSNYTITLNKNAMSAGSISINSGVTVTIPSGSTWAIV